jgi:hypothetical protein
MDTTSAPPRVNLRVLRSNPLKFRPLSNVLTRLIFEPVQRSGQEDARGCTTLTPIVLRLASVISDILVQGFLLKVRTVKPV